MLKKSVLFVINKLKKTEDVKNVGYGLNYQRLPNEIQPMRRLPGDVRAFGSMRLCLMEA